MSRDRAGIARPTREGFPEPAGACRAVAFRSEREIHRDPSSEALAGRWRRSATAVRKPKGTPFCRGLTKPPSARDWCSPQPDHRPWRRGTAGAAGRQRSGVSGGTAVYGAGEGERSVARQYPRWQPQLDGVGDRTGGCHPGQLRGLLADRGYRVVPVHSSDEGLDLAQRMRFDGLLLGACAGPELGGDAWRCGLAWPDLCCFPILCSGCRRISRVTGGSSWRNP